MKHIIFIIILIATAIAVLAVIAWIQAKPLAEPSISVSTEQKTLTEEIDMIDIGSVDDGFQAIDADIEQLQ